MKRWARRFTVLFVGLFALVTVPFLEAGEHGGREHAGSSVVKKQTTKRSSSKQKAQKAARAARPKKSKSRSDRTTVGPIIE